MELVADFVQVFRVQLQIRSRQIHLFFLLHSFYSKRLAVHSGMNATGERKTIVNEGYNECDLYLGRHYSVPSTMYIVHVHTCSLKLSILDLGKCKFVFR